MNITFTKSGSELPANQYKYWREYFGYGFHRPANQNGTHCVTKNGKPLTYGSFGDCWDWLVHGLGHEKLKKLTDQKYMIEKVK